MGNIISYNRSRINIMVIKMKNKRKLPLEYCLQVMILTILGLNLLWSLIILTKGIFQWLIK